MEGENDQKVTETVSVSPKPNSSSSLYVVFKYLGIGMGILGIGFIIALVGYLFAQNNNQQKTTTPVTATKPISPTTSPTPTKSLSSSIEDTGVVNQKRYTNPGFGISFVFPGKFAGETLDVKELGNKIYLYDTKYPYTQGQYIEVFQKNPADTLEQAIQKQFLTDISPNDCFVKDAKPDQGANFPVNYEVKTLGYPVDPNSDLPFFAQPNKCPTPYAETNGMLYFLGDTKHPKIFLFFSIGQMSFPITENSQTSWQDTIQFLN